MKKIISKNEKETKDIGFSLGKNCEGGEIFLLSGDLGAGKTILSKGIALGLGLKKNITSPTFIIMNIYEIKKPLNKIKRFVHVDAYRIIGKEDLYNIGLLDLLKDDGSVVVLEWGDKIKKFLPTKSTNIKIKNLKQGFRSISIN
jgi:tRNA threonylcarbamoyladenosine biosynthesis protein TsaE